MHTSSPSLFCPQKYPQGSFYQNGESSITPLYHKLCPFVYSMYATLQHMEKESRAYGVSFVALVWQRFCHLTLP